jgi:hypothetical protein
MSSWCGKLAEGLPAETVLARLVAAHQRFMKTQEIKAHIICFQFTVVLSKAGPWVLERLYGLRKLNHHAL